MPGDREIILRFEMGYTPEDFDRRPMTRHFFRPRLSGISAGPMRRRRSPQPIWLRFYDPLPWYNKPENRRLSGTEHEV